MVLPARLKSGASFGPLTWMEGLKHLSYFLLLFPGHQQRMGSGAGTARTRGAQTDARVRGSNFTHYATTLTCQVILLRHERKREKEKEREREKVLSLLLIHSTNAHNERMVWVEVRSVKI